MKQLNIVPHGFPCCLIECPPGLFLFDGTLGFRTEYGTMDSYVVESGEAFWGGASDDGARAKLLVQPCIVEWEVRG